MSRPCLAPPQRVPGPPLGPWYGTDATWRLPFERVARRRHRHDLQVVQKGRRLTYQHSGLEVRGRVDCVPVRIEFRADARYDDYGLDPQDYPSVYADPGASSPHRMQDDALCLYFPGDPAEMRWQAEHGLAVLLELTREHLFAEYWWRATGGHPHGRWVLAEAPHGFPARRTR